MLRVSSVLALAAVLLSFGPAPAQTASQYNPMALSDVNLDGRCDYQDLRLIVRYLTARPAYRPIEVCNASADFDGDQLVTWRDARLMLRALRYKARR